MGVLLSLSCGIDAVTALIGRWVYWLVLVAVLVSAGNAIVRKLFNISSNAWLETPVVSVRRRLPAVRGLHAAAQRACPHRHRLRHALARARSTGSTCFGHVFFLLPLSLIFM